MNRLMMFAALAATCVCACGQNAEETLIIQPYPATTAWKSIESVEGNAGIWHEWFPRQMPDAMWLEWIPADQTSDKIQDLIVQQSYPGLAASPPSGLLAPLLQNMAKVCRQARINGPIEKIENGYTVAYGQHYCVGEKRRHQDIDSFIKVIGGKTALHVVMREFYRPEEVGAQAGVRHFKQTEEAQAHLSAQKGANDFLAAVRVCRGKDACPAPLPTQTTPKITSEPTAEDRDPFGFFAVKKSTAEEVKAKLGKPEMENHNPDGRFVYIYKSPAGVYVTYLFDKAGVLTAIRGYML